MKVVNEINDQECGTVLRDTERVEFIKKASLIGSGSEEALDRLTFLASKLLDVPLTIVSFVGDKSQYFKSFHGLPEPWSSNREIPIDVSVCQYTLIGDILSLKDVREHPLLANNPAVPALNLVGYLGVPLLTKDGKNLGAFCAISDTAREWSEDDIEILKTLTKSVMNEIELKLTIDQLAKEKEDWEKTVSMLLHDLRGPLGTILGWAQVGSTIGDRDLEQEAFASVSRCANEGVQIVDNILNWRLSNLNNNKKLIKQNFNINNYLLKYIRDKLQTKNIQIHHDLEKNSIKIYGHENSILRAITNLIDNAIKYGDNSRPITLKIFEDNTYSIINVHNFGFPIEEKQLSKIFDYFETDESLENISKEGWGIGLHLVDSVAKAHNGSVSVKSSEDSGTEFQLKIARKK